MGKTLHEFPYRKNTRNAVQAAVTTYPDISEG